MRYFTYQQLGNAGVLSVNEAAQVLRIGRTRMYELIACGEIKTLSFKTPIRISALWLKAYIDGDAHSVAENPVSRTHTRVGSL